VKKDKELYISADGTIPAAIGGIKVTYSETEFNTNWLLNKVLGTRNLQITKISDDEILKFLVILNETRLQMPDGTDSLLWLRQRLDKRYMDSQGQRGESWESISRRYQFILHQIDIMLATRAVKST
jgi:hypothetical protein